MSLGWSKIMATNKTPPLCVDCRHHGVETAKAIHVCKRKPPMTNSITGEPFWTACKSERSPSFFGRLSLGGSCGETGRHFEARQGNSGGVQFRWETPPDGED